jgi:hypothetical protein
LTVIKRIKTKIIGYDLKKDVIEKCANIAKKYEYFGIEFITGDIGKMSLYSGNVDMIITLHACDTATDYALWYAIRSKIKYVCSVPCCQQEVNSQISLPKELAFLTRYGLFKERLSSILTDCIRCEVLRTYGYDVDLIEFVDHSNTPKNALIRAELKHNQKDRYLPRLSELLKSINVSQTLMRLIKDNKIEY